MQQLIVLLVILVAAFFIGRRFWRFLRSDRKNPCGGGCCGCSGPAAGSDCHDPEKGGSLSRRPPGKQS
ncbi:MAG TPA: FeoB-associated Cys-rich membrane protein [Desulfobulbus sp.]|nr:FeoB-associated Cys-rich membrane protein [Desulfobulbus sp.]